MKCKYLKLDFKVVSVRYAKVYGKYKSAGTLRSIYHGSTVSGGIRKQIEALVLDQYGQVRKDMLEIDWYAVSAKVSEMLGYPYEPRYVRLVYVGRYKSAAILEAVRKILKKELEWVK